MSKVAISKAAVNGRAKPTPSATGRHNRQPVTPDGLPTPGEWERRQRKAPPELIRILSAARVAATAAERKRQQQLTAEGAKLIALREGFEAALSAIIARESADWLNPYRVPESQWSGQWAFSADHYSWLAEYDLTPFGCHPIRIRLSRGTKADSWHRDEHGWAVRFPHGERSFGTLAEAVSAAAVYSGKTY